jgi:Flp pilus assembly pilin Flp
MKQHKNRMKRQAGVAMIEYTVVTVAIGIALLTPLSFTENMPPAEYLAKAVRAFFRAYSLMVSVI